MATMIKTTIKPMELLKTIKPIEPLKRRVDFIPKEKITKKQSILKDAITAWKNLPSNVKQTVASPANAVETLGNLTLGKGAASWIRQRSPWDKNEAYGKKSDEVLNKYLRDRREKEMGGPTGCAWDEVVIGRRRRALKEILNERRENERRHER